MRRSCFVAALCATVLATAAVGANGKPAGKDSAPAKALTVNELAAKAADHLGHVSVVGVVATVDKKGFILIDQKEFKDCGLTCLGEAGTKKISVQWTGDAPQVKRTVRVEGELLKAEKGFTFTAKKVGKP